MKVVIVYPIDDLFEKFGGIESCIKDYIKFSSDDIEIIGITKSLKIGKWHNLVVDGKKIRFFPILKIKNPNKRTLVPLILKYTLALFFWKYKIDFKNKILMFHRLEPVLPLWNVRERKILFVHGDIRNFSNLYCESKWKNIRSIYSILETFFISQMKKIFVVSQEGCKYYKNKYLKISERFEFLPTWYNEKIFYRDRDINKQGVLKLFNIEDQKYLILFVGRLEKVKRPLLIIEVFTIVNQYLPNSSLIIIGDGSLKEVIIEKVKSKVLERKVYLLGKKTEQEISKIMNISNLLLLTSGFEGMPIVVLEALACGIPVVCTKVGEVELVVKEGISGKVVDSSDPDKIATAVIEVLKNPPSSESCQKAVSNYSQEKVINYLISKIGEV
jgi:glycosyltransferase involved in cell wall biosynthesis